MTFTVISTDIIGAGFGTKITVTGDEAFVLGGVNVVSTGVIGLWGTAASQTFHVAGTVAATTYSSIILEAISSTVAIFSTGLASSLGTDNGTPAIVFFSQFGKVHNSGEVVGHDGIEFDGGGAKLFNFGLISGIGEAGTYQAGDGIVLGSTVNGDVNANIIVNHGTIAGLNHSIHSFGNAYHPYQTVDIVKNFGLLQGDVDLGGREDKLVNGGSVVGDVVLGDDNDSYFGKSGGSVSGTIFGGGGEDLLKGSSAEDSLNGGAGKDTIRGRGGDDVIVGGDSADYLFGGNGDDTISGGGGNDKINGGRGDDVLTSNGGKDDFIFNLNSGNDVITDFSNGNDDIELHAFNLNGISDVLAVATHGAQGVTIDLTALGGNGSILMQGFALADLNTGGFLF